LDAFRGLNSADEIIVGKAIRANVIDDEPERPAKVQLQMPIGLAEFTGCERATRTASGL
jgi:hypothetical protein